MLLEKQYPLFGKFTPAVMIYFHRYRLNFGAFIDIMPKTLGLTLMFLMWEIWLVLEIK